MEKKISKLSELGEPTGQLILVKSMFGGEMLAGYISKIEFNGSVDYGFQGTIGSIMLKEGRDNPADLNIRIIDKTHPKWDTEFAKITKEKADFLTDFAVRMKAKGLA